jgi:flagellar biosynthetic protein FliR
MNATVASNELVAILLASIRAAAWLSVAPPFNSKGVPGQAKALLSVAIGFAVSPQLVSKVPSVDSPLFIVSVVEQVAVGLSLGFLTALLFAAIQSAGAMIDIFGGFSVAFAMDPFSQSGNSVFSRLYNTMATTLLFATDGHRLVLRGFTTSYKSLPLDGTLSLGVLSEVVTTGIGQLFVAALQIAGPLVAALLCADLGLGLLTKAAPALNAFALGFPIKILLTLSVSGLALVLMPKQLEGLVAQSLKLIARVLQG